MCGTLSANMTATRDRDARERILVQQVLTFAFHQLPGGAGREAGNISALKDPIWAVNLSLIRCTGDAGRPPTVTRLPRSAMCRLPLNRADGRRRLLRTDVRTAPMVIAE